MTLLKVLPKGQITLPKRIREQLGVHEGDQLLLEVVGEREIRLRVLPRRARLREIGGTVRARRLLDEDSIRQAITEGLEGAGRQWRAADPSRAPGEPVG